MSIDSIAGPFQPGHNHKVCIRDAMNIAEQLCQSKDLRLTKIRKRVLELVWTGHEPATAYQLLKKLRAERENAEPPTVYRALDFLVEHNLVHRIESLNAFIGCDHPESEHVSQFLICSHCNQVAELDDSVTINNAVSEEANRLGFRVSDQTVEIMGLCAACQ
ncbi:MAG: Fur family transcriptional regulator [Arenicellales bacterium]